MMNFKNDIIKLSVIILFLILNVCNAQSYYNTLLNRPSDIYSSDANIWKISRFVPIVSLNSTEDFTSPINRLFWDGSNYNLIPFNFNSPDFIPIDVVSIMGIENQSSFNFRNLTEKRIPDELQIVFKGYTGGVTGDPLIYNFTRDIKESNKNKIIPSAGLTISNLVNRIKYRVTAGYYGYYVTGFGNDDIIRSLDGRFYGKQNKQVLGRVELEYAIDNETKIKFNNSLMTFYGWEATPFLTSFAHLETYLFRSNVEIKNIISDLDVSLTRDVNLTKLHKVNTIKAAEFNSSEYKIKLNYNIYKNEKNLVMVSGGVGLTTTNNKGGLGFQNYFSNEINKTNYRFGVGYTNKSVERLKISFNASYENYLGNNGISGSGLLEYSITKNNKFDLLISSDVKFPNINELYGQLTVNDFSEHFPNNTNYEIIGNEKLKIERINKFVVSYKTLFFIDKINSMISIIYENASDPIQLKTTMLRKSATTGGLLRDAVYTNVDAKKSWSAFISKKIKILNNFSFNSDYKYTLNDDILEVPKNKVSIALAYIFPFNGKVILNSEYKSKMVWEMFRYTKDEDLLAGIGDDGIIDENITFGIDYLQELKDFYLFRSLILRLSVLNIFNKKIKYIPIGNNIERAVIIGINARF